MQDITLLLSSNTHRLCCVCVYTINSLYIPINFRWSAYIIFVFLRISFYHKTYSRTYDIASFLPFWSCLMLLFSLSARVNLNCLFKCYCLRLRLHFHFCYLSVAVYLSLLFSFHVMYRLRIIVCVHWRCSCIGVRIFIYIYVLFLPPFIIIFQFVSLYAQMHGSI